ncbi:MAG: hypothetical protein WC549_02070 [Actinomycetota bacterium]
MKPNNIFIGIDPGVTGAICIITNQTARLWDCPSTVNNMQLIINRIDNKYKKTHNIFAYLENVHTIEKWSRQNGDKLMTNFGQWQGILASYNIPTALVLPKTWQKYVVDKKLGEATKKNSKDTAKKSFYWAYEGWNDTPTDIENVIKNNHNRSDAFLIATFCERTKGMLT